MKYGTMTHLLFGNSVLMIKKFERKNDPNSGYYTLPGGKLEDYEKGTNAIGRLEAAVRELKEETGLMLTNPSQRGVILFDNDGRTFDNWKNPQDFLVYIFGSFSYTGELKKETGEGIPLWVAEKDIPNLPKNPGDAKMYEWLNNPRYFVGVIKHKGKELDEQNTFVDYF